jgi:alkanesulfonate monooxygenase SsuD/methylene tetrahydromethanopterin reductase-like flavin-dependent oxidoreductase (luciferase family)
MAEIRLGITAPHSTVHGPLADRLAVIDAIATAGLDHIAVEDHISFHVGHGTDGLVRAATLLALHDDLEVMSAVYLLPLRHPLPVARQLATIAETFPGRFVFGIGVGGEDRNEVRMCGVDPATRGRRCDESLELLEQLAIGRPVDFRGEFFDVERALILPRPEPMIPVLVGGRSDASVRRTARFGEGWIGIFVSADRYRRMRDEIEKRAASIGRGTVPWRHALYAWCGFGPSVEAARERLAPIMEAVYRIPFEKFERYVPAGTPEEVAGVLAPYVDAGCTRFQLKLVAPDDREGIEAAAEVKRLLTAG